jgi:sporulation protein YlmC with PRC-barrel domain
MDNHNNLLLSSTSIEGTRVRNHQDKKLGDIKDLMIDLDSGRIVYAVLSVSEGFLNLDSKYFAIPWQALQFDTKHEIARLDVNEEKLENSPGFDKDHWPTQPQRDFVDEVYSYYGYDSYYKTRATL